MRDPARPTTCCDCGAPLPRRQGRRLRCEVCAPAHERKAVQSYRAREREHYRRLLAVAQEAARRQQDGSLITFVSTINWTTLAAMPAEEA